MFGISGVVTKPVQGRPVKVLLHLGICAHHVFEHASLSCAGARSEGVEGFFKGIGKGLLGLLTRPTGGVVDMVSTTLDGIRRYHND